MGYLVGVILFRTYRKLNLWKNFQIYSFHTAIQKENGSFLYSTDMIQVFSLILKQLDPSTKLETSTLSFAKK